MNTLQVFYPRLRLVKPRGVTMESGTKAGVFAGHPAVARLMSVDVQDKVIDSVAEHPLTARLEHIRGVRKVESTGECFGKGSPFPVGMSNGAAGAAFDIAQLPF